MQNDKVTIGILGLGQIGGSVAKVLKQSENFVINSFDPNNNIINEAIKNYIIDNAYSDEVQLIESSDVILIATNLGIAIELFNTHKERLRDKELIMDFCSNKSVLFDLAKEYKFNNFIGGHPIAGTELVAPEAWNQELFKDNLFFNTKSENNTNTSKLLCDKIIKSLGARAITVDPEIHDKNCSFTIGVPHVIAFILKRSKEQLQLSDNFTDRLVGPSFQSATRITSSDPEMVDDLIWYYKEHIINHLDDLLSAIAHIKTGLEENDREVIKKLLY